MTYPARRVLLAALLAALLVPGLAGQGTPPPRSVAADFVFPGDTAPLPPALDAAVRAMTPAAVGAHIAALSSPAFEGRGLGQRGLDAAAEYVAAALGVMGLQPFGTAPGRPVPDAAAATAPFFHAVPMREITNPSGEVAVSAAVADGSATRRFLAGVDCLFPEVAPGSVSGGVVFASFGIREQAPVRDDYATLAVKDRIVVLLAGVPDGEPWQAKPLVARYAAESPRRRFEAKAALARSLGARAIIAIEGLDFPPLVASGTGAPASRYFLPYDGGAATDIPVIRISTAAGDAILRSAGLSTASARTAAPRALPGVSLTLTVTGQERLVMGRNVAAVLLGSDPQLRDHAVVVGAHMDHLGRVGDTVYPGADDNASGTAALLEIARAFAAGTRRPKRTIVFLFWTGEEEGHLGSQYYVDHPLWPLDRTAAYLNLDMIGHPWKPEEIRQLIADTKLEKGDQFLARVKAEDFLEVGLPDGRPELDAALTLAARGTGVALHLDRNDGTSGGSDYRAFARRGRPYVRFFGNYFDGYHEPSDTAAQVDPAQVLKMQRLAFAAAWLLADR